jgi:RNA polymerase sigma-B factor
MRTADGRREDALQSLLGGRRTSARGDHRAILAVARWLARRYEGRGEPLEDLCQAASLGLIKAVDRYAPGRGTTFAAYARPVILGEIRRHFRDTTWRVSMPRGLKDSAGRVVRAQRALQPPCGSAPGTEAIARHLGVDPAEVEQARCALHAYWPGSLDAMRVAPDGHRLALREVIGGHEPGYERAEMSVGIGRALRGLAPRDQRVLLLRLACDLSQDEIAGRVGVSQMQVSRILRHATAAVTAACGLAVSA